MNITRLSPLHSHLLVVDVQDKLLVKMPDAVSLVRDVGFLIDVAQLINVPVFATEQYPKGLGPTTEAIARRLPAELPAKLTFSCCGAPGLVDTLKSGTRNQVVLTGMETHVCIMQSALDLLAEGFEVFLPVDALQSRGDIDHDVALARMDNAGAVLTTVEAVAFEWLGSSGHAQFKAISKMIQTRMAEISA